MGICIMRGLIKMFSREVFEELVRETGQARLDGCVGAWINPKNLLKSGGFSVITFSARPSEVFRCDELLSQLEIFVVNDTRYVSVYLAGEEICLEYRAPHVATLCGKVIARCQLK